MKDKKPYTWEEIKEFLVEELGKTKHILTWGIIGSCNVERDIDTIITKKSESPSADFYREIHGIFDNLNDYLNKEYKSKLVRFASHDPEVMQLANFKKNDLAVQTMVYTSYFQMFKDWDWAMFEDEDLKEMLKENYSCLFGSVNDLFSNKFLKKVYGDSIFLYMTHYDRINTNYSKEFLVKAMNYYFGFLFKKRLKIKSHVAKNEKDVRKMFYQLCDELDKLDKKKSK